ncbi:MAG: hypothetical protein HN580_04540 [Deltaproteobacteria bacterium]|nr:hypothetical protein [Deltaproteobacteria bacterium]
MGMPGELEIKRFDAGCFYPGLVFKEDSEAFGVRFRQDLFFRNNSPICELSDSRIIDACKRQERGDVDRFIP